MTVRVFSSKGDMKLQHCLFSGEVYKIDVKEPPQGITPPNQTEKKPHHTNKVCY